MGENRQWAAIDFSMLGLHGRFDTVCRSSLGVRNGLVSIVEERCRVPAIGFPTVDGAACVESVFSSHHR